MKNIQYVNYLYTYKNYIEDKLGITELEKEIIETTIKYKKILRTCSKKV